MVSFMARHLTKSVGNNAFSRRIITSSVTNPSDVNSMGKNSASLYVHWPFCKKLCPYCDFNKYVRRNINEEVMIDCLVRELQFFIRRYKINEITSVYFGGGTPSLAPSHVVSRILGVAEKNNVSIADSAEITLEVNPTSFETEKLRSFKDAGINRTSIGIQALNDVDLEVLGREHSKEDALRCFEKSTQLFGDRVSIDLMFGRPNQTLEGWVNELEELTRMCSEHVSLYQLTMKKHTPMERLHRRGKLILPSDDVIADMYQSSVKVLQSKRLYRYEVSNFARLGNESTHNLSYWQGHDYIGIGAGAHGRLSALKDYDHEKKLRHSFSQISSPEKWIQMVTKNEHGTEKCRTLSQNERIMELILLGLRCRDGISNSVFFTVVGIQVKDLLTLPRIRLLSEENYLLVTDRGVRASDAGLNLLDSIIGDVLMDIEEHLSK